MAKQSISGRVAQLARADLSGLLARSDDPGLLADQLVADYTINIAEAESAIAQAAATRRLLEHDLAEDAASAHAWGARAAQTAARAEQSRAAGNDGTADRLDELVGLALVEQGWAENQLVAARSMIEALAGSSERLEAGLESMRATLELLTTQRDQLVRAAGPRAAAGDAGRPIDVFDPADALEEFDLLTKDELA
jgi:phage shock protein A